MADKVYLVAPVVGSTDHLSRWHAIVDGMRANEKLAVWRPAQTQHMSGARTLLERLLDALLKAPVVAAPHFQRLVVRLYHAGRAVELIQ